MLGFQLFSKRLPLAIERLRVYSLARNSRRKLSGNKRKIGNGQLQCRSKELYNRRRRRISAPVLDIVEILLRDRPNGFSLNSLCKLFLAQA
jgi:hypothetical protein